MIEVGHIAPVPHAPAFVSGLTAMRSRALTVIDARRALGISADHSDSDGRAVVCTLEGHTYAIMVDRVEDVVEATGTAQRPDADLGKAWERVTRALVETRMGPALVVDLAALVAGPASGGTTA
ncbi:chemotaxis protein CheW [Leptolyngbya sp. 15MV]|nr:chemotaxis protein CheW [Leptolyngbya sp. 15MV]